MSAFGNVAAGLLLVASVAPATEVTEYRLMPCHSRPGEHIKLVGDEGTRRNLYHFSRGRWVNVTRFENPHHIFEYGVSPDGRYLFAWHMDFSPRRVSVYDLHRGATRIARFEPEAGGFFCWNSQNHIVHLFGCGSGCLGCKVYGREGRVLFKLGGYPMNVSPSGRYLITYPVAWVGSQEIAIYDLYETSDGSGRIATTPIWNVGSVGEVDKIDWREEQSVTVHYVASDDLMGTSKRQVTLDLQWREGGR